MGMRASSTIKVILLFAVFSLMIPIGDAYSATFTDSLDISGEDTDPQDLAFNTDGTKMFVLGKADSTVFHHVSEYACTTGFDISTCTFSVGESLSVAVQEPLPTGLAFSADGLRMYISGVFGVDVTEFTCGPAAFDVSTCGFPIDAKSTGEDTNPQDLAFNTDGTKMFVLGSAGDEVNEYACGTPFDATSCLFSGDPEKFSVANEDTAPTGLAFNTDGTKMFVVGNGQEVNEYACTTGFDVSTCSFTVKAGNPFSVAAQEIAPTGIAFSADGLTMFVVGNAVDDVATVNEYALGTAFDISTGDLPEPDTTPPDVTVPADVIEDATSPSGAVVTYSGESAFDIIDGAITPTCVPASGSTFAFGDTTVTCTAEDAAGNVGSATFTVTIQACGKPADSFNVITGTAGNDKIKGTNAADLIFGLGGNDNIKGKKGDDCIFGGDGKDKIKGGKGNDTIDGGAGNDKIYGNKGNDTLSGGDGDDKIKGGSGDDTIDGGDGDDDLRGHKGNDIIDGGAGDDKINGNKGTDTCIPDPVEDTTPAVSCEL